MHGTAGSVAGKFGIVHPGRWPPCATTIFHKFPAYLSRPLIGLRSGKMPSKHWRQAIAMAQRWWWKQSDANQSQAQDSLLAGKFAGI
jgi:hypothetical protein